MNTVLFILALLLAILVAYRISSNSNDSNEHEESLDDVLIDVGDLVEFQQEFDDGFNLFYLGEQAWVTKFVDDDHVAVSNKPDGYCANDGCEPFKFCTVPIYILKKVKSN